MGFMCFTDYTKTLTFLYNPEVGPGLSMNHGKALLIIYVKKTAKFPFAKSPITLT